MKMEDKMHQEQMHVFRFNLVQHHLFSIFNNKHCHSACSSLYRNPDRDLDLSLMSKPEAAVARKNSQDDMGDSESTIMSLYPSATVFPESQAVPCPMSFPLQQTVWVFFAW